MSATDSPIQNLFDNTGQVLGVFIPIHVWNAVDAQVPVLVQKAADSLREPAPEPQEPFQDWQTLAQYWDFSYPLTPDVACSHCGNTTPDWQQDSPRKFRLKAANIGGLVTFECQSCRARILKRHFKKHVDVECRPYVEKR